MEIRRYFLPHRFIIICILSSAFYITYSTPVHAKCQEDQKYLLLQLKNDLVFSPSYAIKLPKWNHTVDCCSWAGVECDGKGRVINLQLEDEGISGGISNSSSLFSLKYLQRLNLADNKFNSTQIPRGIKNLTHLTHLNLSDAGFGGQVPAELSLMSRLISLDISIYDSSESDEDDSESALEPLKLKHPNLKMLLQNLTGLRELYLDGIDVSVEGSEWGKVVSSSTPNLRELSLRSCNLSGPLDPSLSQLHSLSVLRLDGNDLSTTVPDFLANFSRLTTLSLSGCFLEGSFPERIFQVPTLEHLDLSRNALLCGTIPQFHQISSLKTLILQSTNFSGTLPDSISNLTMLSEIDLRNCTFSGPIPSTLANLTELIRVDLSANNFTGPIPPFYMATKLSYIDLGRNSLSGLLSSEHFKGLSNLLYIFIDYNLVGGSIPRFLFLLPSLQKLILSNNQFSGRVDEFSTPHSSNLEMLDLSSNRLEGPIPESFYKLENLESLSLSYNFFNGTVRLQRLQNLEKLDLSYNNLSIDATGTNSSSNAFPQLLYHLSLASCNMYNFPDLIKRSNIEFLDLSNNRITGEIPSWIWEIGNGELKHLNLSQNHLVDLQKPYSIPLSLSVLDLRSNQLRGELPLPPPYALYVDYSNNNFESTIPLNIVNVNASSPWFLSLANNRLTGAIPTSLCDAIYLQVLDLSENKLTGNLPPCLVEKLESLGVLSLGRNNISGKIPDNFPINCGLQTLELSNNNLGGKLPQSLSNCKSLEVLNVGNNNLNDSFPCMQLSSSLHVLVLRSNRFQGEVRCHRNWTNLQIIDIASNNFNGRLYPEIFSSWTGMMLDNDAQSASNHLRFDILRLNNFYYHDRVTLTIKGLELQIVRIKTYFTSIDFSSNKFQGDIPDVIGDLSSLYLFNLSHCALTGNIPKSVGRLKQLGSLDLSGNQLTGEIPVELAELTFLSVLNLSYNKLVGKIPVGRQFQTFSLASFQGNTGLCGFPVNISCKDSDGNIDASPPTLLERETSEIHGEYVSAALGFVVGLGSILWLLWGCQSVRLKFSDLVDRFVVKIFGHKDGRRHGGRVLRNQVRKH